MKDMEQSRNNKEKYMKKTGSGQTGKIQRSNTGRRYLERQKQLKRRKYKRIALGIVLLIGAILILYVLIRGVIAIFNDEPVTKSQKTVKVELQGSIEDMQVEQPELNVQLLTPNKYSRPQTALKNVNGIVIHYVANPGTTAQQNRNYFENLKDTHETKASSHFVIGTDGEIVQCIPTSEISYCSNERNDDTIAIECCHLSKDGRFTKETYESLVELTAFLCCKFDLEMDDIIRHYDITGKMCPKYYVTHEDKWTQFKKDVAEYIEDSQ